MIKRNKYILTLIIALTVISAFSILNWVKYKYPKQSENNTTIGVYDLDNKFSNQLDSSQIKLLKNNISEHENLKRLNFLERKLCGSVKNAGEIAIENNKEWVLFSYSYTTYALTNICKETNSSEVRFKSMMKTMIEKVLSSEICSSFGVDSSTLQNNYIPNYSVLYLGHLNMMLGCYRSCFKDSCYNRLNDLISRSLAMRYGESKCMNLESYPGSIWISDNTVALASLYLHSDNTSSNYKAICDSWVNLMKEKYIENTTGLLYSTINSQTGKPEEEPRGSMTAWNIIFISRFDEAFAIELYNSYFEHFSDNYGAFRLFKERKGNSETSYGDIDSGPLLAGYGIPSNVFAIACARIAEDYKTAKQIENLLEIGARKIDKNNEIFYDIRFVDMEYSPLAEAIVLFSITVNDWKKKSENK